LAGDGQGVSQWGRSLEAADAERFAAHERFFVEDVRVPRSYLAAGASEPYSSRTRPGGHG
jgi:hypothetical protein